MTDELKPCLAYPCGGIMEANIYDASLTCSRCQFQVADESEYSALVAGRQAAIDDENQNPWKAAIIQELIVGCIFAKEHESDPRKALAAAIDWNCKVALDPSVSKEAMELQQQAIDAALESVADLLDSGDDWNTGDEIAEFIRSRIGTNPLAERDARIAELERELSTKDDKDAAQQVPGLGDKAIPARTVLEWMEEAKEDMQDWACYASEYFQEKHNLAADLGKMNARIAILERILVDEPPNMPAPKASG